MKNLLKELDLKLSEKNKELAKANEYHDKYFSAIVPLTSNSDIRLHKVSYNEMAASFDKMDKLAKECLDLRTERTKLIYIQNNL